MKPRLTRPLALGAVGLLAVAGGGAAYAATSGTNPRDALLNDAAKRLNIDPDKLAAALQSAAGDQLDQAVKDGRLTQAQADHMKQELKRHGGLPPMGAPGPGPGGFERHGLRGGPGGPPAGLHAAASYLGLTDQQLAQQLRNGKSLADVAKAQGKSLDGLEQAIVAAEKARLDKAVAAGDLTAAQRDEMLKRLQEHVSDLVQGKGPGPGAPCGPGGPPPSGGPGGSGSGGNQGSSFATTAGSV